MPNAAPMRAYLLLFTTVVFWGISPLFVKFLSGYYNVWTQNAFRFGCAAGILLAWAALRRSTALRRRFGKRAPLLFYETLSLRPVQWRAIALVAGINVFSQSVFAAIFYFIFPAVGILISSLNLLFTALISFAVLREERRSILSPYFLTGSFLAICGVTLVVFLRDPEILRKLDVSNTRFWIGVGLALTYALTQALYIIAIRRAVKTVHPIVSFTHVAWMSTAGLAALMLALGGLSDILTRPLWLLPFMALTALVSIVIAHVAIYAALQMINASVSTALLQFTPVITCFSSALVFGDKLTPAQAVGGIAVLAGAWLASLAQQKQ